MSDAASETTNAQPAEGATLETAADTPRAPLDAEKRQRAAEAQAVRRRTAKLAKCKTIEEFRETARDLLGEDAPAAAATVDVQKVEPSKPAAAPSRMPAPEKVAAMRAPAANLWLSLAAPLEGTRYDLTKPQKVLVGGEVIEVNKVEILADGTAPLLAKLAGRAEESPEGAFIAALVLVFGPPLVTHGAELGAEWWKNRKTAEPAK